MARQLFMTRLNRNMSMTNKAQVFYHIWRQNIIKCATIACLIDESTYENMWQHGVTDNCENMWRLCFRLCHGTDNRHVPYVHISFFHWCSYWVVLFRFSTYVKDEEQKDDEKDTKNIFYQIHHVFYSQKTIGWIENTLKIAIFAQFSLNVYIFPNISWEYKSNGHKF